MILQWRFLMQWETARPTMYPSGSGCIAPGVHVAEWAGDPAAAAHLEVGKRRVSICFPGDGRAERLLCSQ